MAEQFANNTEELLEYGKSLQATTAEQKAYYQAMAT
jgi:hypothetical protein